MATPVKKVIAVTKTFEIVSATKGRRVFFVGEPFIVLEDQYEWFKREHAGYILNLTQAPPSPVAQCVQQAFGG